MSETRHNISIEDVRSLCAVGMIIWTEHCGNRMRERLIKRADVLYCIKHGEIIENYPDDISPSCLVLGCSIAGAVLHVVCGIKDGTVRMITAYYPNMTKWENDYRTRKAVE